MSSSYTYESIVWPDNWFLFTNLSTHFSFSWCKCAMDLRFESIVNFNFSVISNADSSCLLIVYRSSFCFSRTCDCLEISSFSSVIFNQNGSWSDTSMQSHVDKLTIIFSWDTSLVSCDEMSFALWYSWWLMSSWSMSLWCRCSDCSDILVVKSAFVLLKLLMIANEFLLRSLANALLSFSIRLICSICSSIFIFWPFSSPFNAVFYNRKLDAQLQFTPFPSSNKKHTWLLSAATSDSNICSCFWDKSYFFFKFSFSCCRCWNDSNSTVESSINCKQFHFWSFKIQTFVCLTHLLAKFRFVGQKVQLRTELLNVLFKASTILYRILIVFQFVDDIIFLKMNFLVSKSTDELSMLYHGFDVVYNFRFVFSENWLADIFSLAFYVEVLDFTFIWGNIFVWATCFLNRKCVSL